MGNLVRSILLLLTIAAAVVAGIYHYKADLIDSADWHFQHWYVEPFQDELEAVQELEIPEESEQAIDRLEVALKDLRSTRIGDNRFSVWRQMTRLLGTHYSAIGRDVDCIRILLEALKLDPNNLELRADLVRALIRVGSPESLSVAKRHLGFLTQRFPNWSLCGDLAMAFAVEARDGAALAKALEMFQRNQRAELLKDWQVFLFPEEGKHTASALEHATQDGDDSLARLVIETDVPEGGISRLRLDPPSNQFGTVRDWSLSVKDSEGREIVSRLTAWSSQQRVEFMEDGAVRLVGKGDPQLVLVLATPLEVAATVQVEFLFRPESNLPEDVRLVLEDESVRKDFEAYFAKQGGGN